MDDRPETAHAPVFRGPSGSSHKLVDPEEVAEVASALPSMDIAERTKRYAAIEDYRKRPMIVYATSTRPGVRAQMAGDAVREFIDQLDKVVAGDAIDILVHSSGGDALTAWKLMSVLRERFKNVAVLVPFAAFSAATIFALGADEIVMHPHASLGPIDPQIAVKLPDGKIRGFAYEDLGAFLSFLQHDMKLTEQKYTSSVVDKLFSTVDPLVVGAAKRASDLSVDVGARLLSMHQPDDRKAKQIALNLNKSFFAHGDAVSRQRALKLELPVAKKADARLEALLWDAYLGIETYMELRRPFDALQTFLADPTAAASFVPTAPLLLPSNTPPQVVKQAWEAAANNALQAAQAGGVEVKFTLLNALIESPRAASEFRTTGGISAFRIPGGEVRVHVVETATGWNPVAIPAAAGA